MDRRCFLLSLAAATLAGLTGCGQSSAKHPPSHREPSLPPLLTGAPLLTKVAPAPVIEGLPGAGRELAWTVDDGADSAVLGAYLDFLNSTGLRLTFFVTGSYSSWTEHAGALRPLVESGQVQLGNHTWTHPDLSTLPDSQISVELARTDRFIRDTFGVSARPFLRPPYGSHDARTDRIAADHGYDVITMWYGSLGDSAVLTPAQVLANGRQWMTAQRIVIGHANHPAVTHVYGQLVDLIRARRLHAVTLNDVFAARPAT